MLGLARTDIILIQSINSRVAVTMSVCVRRNDIIEPMNDESYHTSGCLRLSFSQTNEVQEAKGVATRQYVRPPTLVKKCDIIRSAKTSTELERP